MTEETPLPAEAPAPIPPAAVASHPVGPPITVAEERASSGSGAALPLAIVSLLGVIGVAAFVVWNSQQPPPPTVDPARIDALEQRANAPRPPSIDPARIDALEKQASASKPAAIDPARIDALEKEARASKSAIDPARIDALEKEVSASKPPAIDPARIDALEKEASAPKAPSTDPARVDTLDKQVAALTERLTQLEQKPAPVIPVIPPPPDLGPLEQRIDALEKRLNAPTDTVSHGDLTALAGRVDQLATRADALGNSQKSDLGAVTARLDAADTKLQADDKLAGQLGGISDKQARIAQLQGATAALDAGQKLGDLPDAPPALQKFAQTAPPTEASLRLSFDEAARSVQVASRPTVDDQPLLERMWFKAQQSVTVRQGDHVVLGDPVTGVLEHARLALYAGDLVGAVSTLDQLAGPAAAAMAPWKANAQSLIDARAALLSLARG